MTGSDRVSSMMNSRNAKSGVRIINSRVKKSGFHMTRKQIFLSICMLFLIMGLSIGYVWSSLEGTQRGYDMSQFKKMEMDLREVNRKLRLELATVTSTKNLEVLAIEKLGLRQPSPDQIVVLP